VYESIRLDLATNPGRMNAVNIGVYKSGGRDLIRTARGLY
jgi:hypothetical protein